MTTDQKQQIVQAAKDYCLEHSLSNNDLSNKTGINNGYLSSMLRGLFTTLVNEKQAEISDKWFVKLADFIGVPVKKAYWETQVTMQFTEVLATLEEAKDNSTTAMIIGPTGTGKSYAVEKFRNKHPQHTYVITINGMYKISDIINDLLYMLGVDPVGSQAFRMSRIINKLKSMKQAGAKPIVILDEFENAKLPLIKMTKALYDGIKNYSSIVLIGTDQLINKLQYLYIRNKEGVPQFNRRFKAGRRFLTPIDKGYNVFLNKYVEDKGLRKLLVEICDNYGELNDYLEPALREASERGVALTEEFFRTKYNMPKY